MAQENRVSPSFKKVLVAASIGAVAAVSLYLAVPQSDKPNNDIAAGDLPPEEPSPTSWDR